MNTYPEYSDLSTFAACFATPGYDEVDNVSHQSAAFSFRGSHEGLVDLFDSVGYDVTDKPVQLHVGDFTTSIRCIPDHPPQIVGLNWFQIYSGVFPRPDRPTSEQRLESERHVYDTVNSNLYAELFKIGVLGELYQNGGGVGRRLHKFAGDVSDSYLDGFGVVHELYRIATRSTKETISSRNGRKTYTQRDLDAFAGRARNAIDIAPVAGRHHTADITRDYSTLSGFSPGQN